MCETHVKQGQVMARDTEYCQEYMFYALELDALFTKIVHH